jgi:ABC-2 type transport system ATP-binding protein
LETLPAILQDFGAQYDRAKRAISFSYRPKALPVARLLAAVQAAGLSIVDLTTEEADLEDLFLELTRGA